MDDQVDVVEMQEALSESRAEVERLQTVVADREAQTARLRESLTEVQQSVGAATAETVALRAQLEAAQTEAGSLREALAEATERNRSTALKYRDAMLAASPELPAGLVNGESVEAIDASLDQARQMVSQLRGHLETQPPARVPTGAPARARQDFSALSPEEKIALGLRKGV